MDRIIFGDNQFFGINHMSEDKAQEQSERFRDLSAIIRVVDMAYDCGIHAFMFNTHDRVAQLCDHFRANQNRYADLRIYPSMPYAHKYANMVNEKGAAGALNELLFAGNTAGQVIGTIFRGGMSVLTQNMIEVMKLLVDQEMKMFRELNVRVVFLQNIITDLLLGLGVKEPFIEFTDYVNKKYNAEAGFNSMNMPLLLNFLEDAGLHNPIICSSINKIGYLMNPDVASYEAALKDRQFRPMAMSILASGAVPPPEAIDYVLSFGKVQSIVFGASSQSHIEYTKTLIDERWPA